MICPCEKKGETSVVDSRPTEDGTAIRRRRLCSCGERFTTFERVQFQELTVIKGNSKREPFDRDKISKSIRIATRKRPIDSETIEKFFLLSLLLFSTVELIGEDNFANTENANIDIIYSEDFLKEGDELILGLRFKLTPGWHIYWKNPGDSGLPPELVLRLLLGNLQNI